MAAAAAGSAVVPQTTANSDVPPQTTVAAAADDGKRLDAHTIRADERTYRIFRGMMDRARHEDESSFLSFLMAAAISKLQDIKTAVAASSAEEDCQALLTVESGRTGVAMETITSLMDPLDVGHVSALEMFDSLERSLKRGVDAASPRPGAADAAQLADSQSSAAKLVANQPAAEGDRPNGDGEANDLVCSRCGRDRMTSKELAEHAKHCDILEKYKRVKKTPPPRFIHCAQCGMRFGNSADYRKHYSHYHTNYPVLYACEFCNKKQTFTDKRRLNQHKRTEPVCQECRRRYVSVDTLNVHLRNKNHDKERREQLKSAKARSKSNPTSATVSSALEAVTNTSLDKLPPGYSFMSVKLNPLYRTSEERLVLVPQTANRQGYALQTEFLNPPYPIPPIRTQATSGSETD